jgi:hypothetical protein
MMLALRTALLLGLSWALSSFGFAAVSLTTLFGQPSNIDADQIYGVAAASGVATVVGLGLAVLVSLRLTGKGDSTERVASPLLMTIGICFAGVAAWSFLVGSSADPDHFFIRFLSGARFEFLMIAVAALVMGLRKA